MRAARRPRTSPPALAPEAVPTSLRIRRTIGQTAQWKRTSPARRSGPRDSKRRAAPPCAVRRAPWPTFLCASRRLLHSTRRPHVRRLNCKIHFEAATHSAFVARLVGGFSTESELLRRACVDHRDATAGGYRLLHGTNRSRRGNGISVKQTARIVSRKPPPGSLPANRSARPNWEGHGVANRRERASASFFGAVPRTCRGARLARRGLGLRRPCRRARPSRGVGHSGRTNASRTHARPVETSRTRGLP